MTKSEKIDKIVEGLEQSTDFEIMKEMKAILNKVFGEANNQILKPNYFSARRVSGEDGLLANFLHMAGDSTPEELENWMKSYMAHSLYYQILIKFPEVTITNGEDKHVMKDLYVRSFVRPNGTMRSGICGIRSKLNIAEIRSQYAHSHLPYCNARDVQFQPFCTGIGPINQVMMLLNSKFTYVNFMMFCLHLKTFVAWESKEGKPHMYIENIYKANDQAHYYLYPSYATEVGDLIVRLMKNVPPEHVLGLFDYDVLPTRIEVKTNDAFEKWACELIRSWDIDSMFPGYGWEKDNLLNTKDNNGRYYPIPRRDLPPDQYDSNKVLLQFKGEDIKLEVEFPPIIDAEIIKDEEKVPHHSIIQQISKKLTSSFSKTAFNNARIKLGCAGVHKSEATGSNQLSL
jgi:hypothetical protein